MKKLIPFVFLIIGFTSVTSEAIVELRLQPTYHLIAPDAFNDYVADTSGGLGDYSYDELSQFITLGFDAIVTLPMLPVGLGARYEYFGFPKQEQTDSGVTASLEFAVSRLSLVANYRLLDTFFWFGPIATLGLIHNMTFDVNFSAGGGSFEVDDFDMFSYSIGAEGGIALGFFLVGAEAGYMGWNYANLKTNGGGDAPFDEFDLSGIYFKLLLGITI